MRDFRGPDFIDVICSGSFPLPSPSSVSKLYWRPTGRLRKRDTLLTGRREGRGKEPNHRTARKPGTLFYVEYSLGQWSEYSQNHSTLN